MNTPSPVPLSSANPLSHNFFHWIFSSFQTVLRPTSSRKLFLIKVPSDLESQEILFSPLLNQSNWASSSLNGSLFWLLLTSPSGPSQSPWLVSSHFLNILPIESPRFNPGHFLCLSTHSSQRFKCRLCWHLYAEGPKFMCFTLIALMRFRLW